MTRQKWLRWAAVLGPGVIAGGFETVRHAYLERWLTGGLGNLATAAMVMTASSLLLFHIFRRLDRWEQAAQQARARQAALEERARIAADLHDDVGQSLFYLNVQLESAQGLLDAGDEAALKRQLADMRAVVGRLYDHLRRVIFDLKSADPHPGTDSPGHVPAGAGPADGRRGDVTPRGPGQDLPAMVRRFAAEFQEQSGVIVELVACTHQCRDDCPGAELELLRILQEAVTNAHRHGQASTVRISLESSGGRDVLTVEDDGCGFEPESAPDVQDGHFGLAVMQDRARRLGGRLHVRSRPGHGTVVRFERVREQQEALA